MSPETLSAARRPFSLLRKCIATVALSGSLPDKLRAAAGVGEKVRLVLNASESRSTATSRFVRAYTGADMHHVAFGTTDIVRAAEHLAASQVRRLSLPANDYDDLSARWNLDDQILNALQRHRLLYDREAVGEFHHLCTGTFRIASSSRPCSAAALTLDSEPRTPWSGGGPGA